MVTKIAILSRYFWPDGGGAEQATYLILEKLLLKETDFRVTVISGSKSPMSSVIKSCRYIYWEPFSDRRKPMILLKSMAKLNELMRLIKDADVIYIPSNALLPLTIWIKRRYPDKKVVLHLHDFQVLTYESAILHDKKTSLRDQLLFEYYDNKGLIDVVSLPYLNWSEVLYSTAPLYADDVICVSRSQANIIEGKLGIKCKVVYNFLPEIPSLSKEFNSEPLFLFLGGNRYIKGFYTLLHTIHKMINGGFNIKENIHLIIAGTRMRGVKEILLNKLRLTIMEKVPHSEALRFISSSWATLFTSIIEEPLPYAVIESALLRTIPISVRGGSITEILGGTRAEKFMVDYDNAEESIIDKINEVISLERDELLSIGEELRSHVLNLFNATEIRRRLLMIFKVE